MVKANELRIGNLVLLNNKHVAEVQRLDAEDNTSRTINPHNRYLDGSRGDVWHLPTKYVTGILITPEWLERLGFARIGSSWSKEGVSILSVNDDSKPELVYGGFEIYQHHRHIIKYVHQLQNLYFALTGEELNVKIKTTHHDSSI